MRYLENENPYIICRFTTGDTATIDIYDLSDDSKDVDGASMSEIGLTGYFKYLFNPDIAVLKEYLYIADNSIEEHSGKIILGGYPDTILENTNELQIDWTDGGRLDLLLDRILTATEIKQFVINDTSASTTKMETTLTEINNFWVRAAILFTTGNNAGQIRGIKNYSQTNGEIQLQTAVSYTPANGDLAIIMTARKFLTPDTTELAADVKTAMEGVGTKLTEVKIQTDKINFSGDDNIQTRVADKGVLNDLSGEDINSVISNNEVLKRVIGLMHENIFIDNPIYDDNDNLKSARIRIYSDSMSVGTDTNIIGSYIITSIGSGRGKFTTWSQIKN
jgi:hypothetical protein